MTRYAKGRKCNRYLRGNLSTDTNPEITNGGAKDAKATIKTMNRYFSTKFSGQKGIAQYIQSAERKNLPTLPEKAVLMN